MQLGKRPGGRQLESTGDPRSECVLQDIYAFHCAGKPYFDAAKSPCRRCWWWQSGITTRRLYGTNVVSAAGEFTDKRLVELREGSHHIMLEKNRMELFEAVQTFLDDDNGNN